MTKLCVKMLSISLLISWFSLSGHEDVRDFFFAISCGSDLLGSVVLSLAQYIPYLFVMRYVMPLFQGGGEGNVLSRL